jgi:hypothetical protein
MLVEKWIPWPTEPGYYWFYGWKFGQFDKNPKYHSVEAVLDGGGKLMVVGDGHFWHKEHGMCGLFAHAEQPEPPTLPKPGGKE